MFQKFTRGGSSVESPQARPLIAADAPVAAAADSQGQANAGMSTRHTALKVYLHEKLLSLLNLSVLDRASVQVTTLPSGHAAGAMATALAVSTSLPVAGIAFLFMALSISIATVLGRYHYVVDTVLGVLVAIIVWQLT